ncbi:regulatory protein RecX [Pedomonas mirosovicensis]|uniref:regulatory protein RecX n=1 Tax=Pedomonas mirosovicensis TaxID=2908641 RepID=UPI0021685F59|nr:regulatory protein RecX [Pedomonas mirosovicensis]MCH8685230.1 RecX family transcriptional regulator [Pedomonas mirosovicensis]
MSQAPLNTARLKDLALHYVSRYATTRHKLATYLRRKVREKGWETGADVDISMTDEGEASAAEAAINETLDYVARLGAVDDAAFAEGRARALTRRGMGAHRIRQALSGAGIERGVADEAIAETDALEAAIAFLRRRRWGPFGEGAPHDPDARRKAFAAMMRAGHPPDLAGKLLRLVSEEELEQFPRRARRLIVSL